MNANIYDMNNIRKDLENNAAVSHCAKRYSNTGDPTSMKACYLLRHHPDLSVSQLAELVGASISAMSRCLQRLSHSEVVSSRKEGRAVYYSLEDNDFTKLLVKQMEGGA